MVRSVLRAVDVLQLLADGGSMSVTEVSRHLGIPKSTAHDLLSTLERQNLLTREPESNVYGLGWRLFELGRKAQENMELRKLAQPSLRWLHDLLDETVHLTVLDHGEVLYVDCFESSRRLRTYSVIGVRAPLHCTAVGKAIMAFLDADALDLVIEQYGLARFTERTITDRAALLTELERVRSNGYAVDDMEHEPGVRCIGAPIRDNAGTVIASLSLSGPSPRITPSRISELGRVVKEAADQVSGRLGYRKTPGTVMGAAGPGGSA